MSKFPVLLDRETRDRFPDCPRFVPYEVVSPHEDQALDNHDQDLALLARRGGLCPVELYAVVHGRAIRDVFRNVKLEDAVDWLRSVAESSSRA